MIYQDLDRLGKLIAQEEQIFILWAKQQNIHYPTFIVYNALIQYRYCTQKRICQEWEIPKRTLSSLCQQLEQQGDILFKEGEDKREKYMQLTKQSLSKAKPIVADFNYQHTQAFSKLRQTKNRANHQKYGFFE